MTDAPMTPSVEALDARVAALEPARRAAWVAGCVQRLFSAYRDRARPYRDTYWRVVTLCWAHSCGLAADAEEPAHLAITLDRELASYSDEVAETISPPFDALRAARSALDAVTRRDLHAAMQAAYAALDQVGSVDPRTALGVAEELRWQEAWLALCEDAALASLADEYKRSNSSKPLWYQRSIA